MAIQVSPLTLPIASSTPAAKGSVGQERTSPLKPPVKGVRVVRGLIRVKGNEFNNNIKALTARSVLLNGDEEFAVDGVLSERDGVYDLVVDPCLEYLFKGKDCCLLAMGQSGAGKSFTLFNDGTDKGAVPLLFKEIIKRKAMKRHCSATMSLIEIHEDTVVDLLNKSSVCPLLTNGDENQAKSLDHGIDHDTGYLDVEGAVEKQIDDATTCNELLEVGLKRRLGCITPWNTKSSGAHVICRIILTQYQGTNNQRMTSVLDIVDPYVGDNSLKTMIQTLAARTETGGLPQRQSLLTRMLTRHFRDGGENSCTVIACVGSKKNYMPETQEVLRLQQTALQIKNTAKAKEEPVMSIAGPVASVLNGGGGADYGGLNIKTVRSAELERSLKVCQGKLEATQALVVRLEKELHAKTKELRNERQEKILVTQDLQDLTVRMHLMEERYEQQTAKLKEAGEAIVSKEADVQRASLDAFTSDQAVTQLRGSFEEATKLKRAVEEEFEAFKQKVFAIADNKRALDALLELRTLCNKKQQETKSVSKSHSATRKRSKSGSKTHSSAHSHPSPLSHTYGTPPAKARPLSARGTTTPLSARFTRSATGPVLSPHTPRKLSR
eukprot:TRINITY_DN15752_c0_g1_i1.p1 TRINITY_DN15752_c0_g1~~TRINITY_DN15752_c0_g1_i1.p1  ORF type:complete len:609 (+),score=223.46 TRINITY_DN15752_c0_g1_i1:35-1861(+)